MNVRAVTRTMAPAVLAIAVTLVVGACEGHQDETGELAGAIEETEDSAGGDRPFGEEPESEGSQALLEPRGGSAVSGTVASRWLEGTTRVRVALESTDRDARYIGHLHRGSCEEPGRQVVALEPFTRTPDGGAVSETAIDTARLEPGTRHFVQVHGSEHAVVACGSLPDAPGSREAE